MSSLNALASFIITISLERNNIRALERRAYAYSFSENIRLNEPEASTSNPAITINGYEYTVTLDNTVGYVNNLDTRHLNGYIRSYKLTKPKIFYTIYGRDNSNIGANAIFRDSFGTGESDNSLIEILSKRKIGTIMQRNLSPLDQIDLGCLLYEKGLGKYQNIYIHDTLNPIAAENEESLRYLFSSVSKNSKDFSVVIMTGTICQYNDGRNFIITNPHAAILLLDHTKRREGDGDAKYLLDFDVGVYQVRNANEVMVANPNVFGNLAQYIVCLNTHDILQAPTTCTHVVGLTTRVLDRKKEISEIIIRNNLTNNYVLNINFFREILEEVRDFGISYGLNEQNILNVDNCNAFKGILRNFI